MVSPEKFLLPEDDGLEVRKSQEYARYKLKAVAMYLDMASTAIRKKPWRARYYIDLQAGPGKNRFPDGIELGSPLIALTIKHPFTHYRLNDNDPEINQALRQRISASPYQDRVQTYQSDANEVVHQICDEIDWLDNNRGYGKLWSSLNIAFLDPEGLELQWTTVERLAQVKKMDLIINISTMGLLRNIGDKNYDIVNRYFGTTNWQTIYDVAKDATANRRALIDFYLERLQAFGYTHFKTDPDSLGSSDIPFKNSRNTQMYSLLFASKSELGDKLWSETVKRSQEPKLPGFE
jgi:three-Cys-motif partner protein